MTIPTTIQPFWDAFLAVKGRDVTPLFYEAFHFDDNERSANELAALVLSGRKRATAALFWTHELTGKPLPQAGVLSVVTDWQGAPLCVIETAQVDVIPFEEVSEDFAAIEGEGDRSLRYWRDVHWSYFSRECQSLGKEPSLRMPVVCERFEVVYAAPAESRTGVSTT